MIEGSRKGRTAADWVTLAIGILVVGSLAAVALIEEARLLTVDGPAIAIEFEADQVVSRTDGFHVPYTVLNTGDSGISAAEIWVEVVDGERVLESAEIRVEFLPLRGSQDGILVSQFDPNDHVFRGRLESLLLP